MRLETQAHLSRETGIGLAKLRNYYDVRGDTFGLLVCRAPRRQQLSERVMAIPWEEL